MDEYLQAFVRWGAAQHDHDIGVTFTTGGVVVTGHIVSEDEYFESIALEMGYSIERVGQTFGRHEEAHEASLYIHPKNAKLLSGERKPDYVVRWSAPLKAVDGFTIGRLAD